MVVYDFTLGAMRELADLRGASVFSRTDPSVIYLLESAEGEGKARYVIRAVNFRTGASGLVADWTSTDGGGAEFGMSPDSDRLVVGLKEGRALYLIDPRAQPADQRVRRVPLPMRMKGAGLSHNDRRVTWHWSPIAPSSTQCLSTVPVRASCSSPRPWSQPATTTDSCGKT
jgi:hypothetical protein